MQLNSSFLLDLLSSLWKLIYGWFHPFHVLVCLNLITWMEFIHENLFPLWRYSPVLNQTIQSACDECVIDWFHYSPRLGLFGLNYNLLWCVDWVIWSVWFWGLSGLNILMFQEDLTECIQQWVVGVIHVMNLVGVSLVLKVICMKLELNYAAFAADSEAVCRYTVSHYYMESDWTCPGFTVY